MNERNCSPEWILFTSYAPGTGKTFNMLSFAKKYCLSTEIYIGTISNVNRSYCFGLKKEMKKEYKPFNASLDVELLLEKKPKYVLVDELSFSNLKSGNKMYVDAKRIFDHGINIISSCNLQQFDSVNSKCRSIAGISVNHPIPDSYLNDFTKIIFVDCDPVVVNKRYQDGSLFISKSRLLDKYMSLTSLYSYRKVVMDCLKDDPRVIFTKTS